MSSRVERLRGAQVHNLEEQDRSTRLARASTMGSQLGAKTSSRTNSSIFEEVPPIKEPPAPRTGSRPRPQLARATTDIGPSRMPSNDGESSLGTTGNQDNWELRHGWDEEYNSEEYLTILHSVSQYSSTCKSRSLGEHLQLLSVMCAHLTCLK